jgi:hypothetical protein
MREQCKVQSTRAVVAMGSGGTTLSATFGGCEYGRDV